MAGNWQLFRPAGACTAAKKRLGEEQLDVSQMPQPRLPVCPTMRAYVILVETIFSTRPAPIPAKAPSAAAQTVDDSWSGDKSLSRDLRFSGTCPIEDERD
jgi:hypothetical protein